MQVCKVEHCVCSRRLSVELEIVNYSLIKIRIRIHIGVLLFSSHHQWRVVFIALFVLVWVPC
jgi:hypothetical protein